MTEIRGVYHVTVTCFFNIDNSISLIMKWDILMNMVVSHMYDYLRIVQSLIYVCITKSYGCTLHAMCHTE